MGPDLEVIAITLPYISQWALHKTKQGDLPVKLMVISMAIRSSANSDPDWPEVGI